MNTKINKKKIITKNKKINNAHKSKYNIINNKSVKNKEPESVILDYIFDISFLEHYKPSEHNLVIKKINTILNTIITSKVNNINLKYFLKKIKHNIPIRSALNSVPDIMCLPIPIGEESKPIEIYKNYKNNIKYSLDILKSLLIQYRISLLYININKILKNIDINPINYEYIKKILIRKLNINNKNLGYYHLKYLVKVSNLNL